ncbi:ankyrin [Daldinia eschscholtzii]|nr:ankyrin [Daldinia eschscholtzii]
MAKLTDLPVELLQMIAAAKEDFSDILETQDLANLSLVSRWSHYAFNRVLYIDKDKIRLSEAIDYAAIHGNTDTLKVAASFGIDLELSSEVLETACRHGRREVVLWLLERDTPVRLELSSSDRHCFIDSLTRRGQHARDRLTAGCPALLHAICSNMEDIALHLLSLGANPNSAFKTNDNLRSALHYAACRNMIRVVEYLVQQSGIPIDTLDFEDYTPLRFMMRFSRAPDRDTGMVKKLIELGANVNIEADGVLPLTSALRRGRFHQARALLDAGSKIKPDEPQPDILIPLHALIYVRYNSKLATRSPMQWSILRRLIKAGADLRERDASGSTPLEESILNGSPEMTSHLLTMMVKKYGKNSVDYQDLLSFIVENAEPTRFFLEKAEVILKHGGRMDTPLRDGRTFFLWVLKRGDYSQVERMLKIATKSMLNREYLDGLLQDIIADPECMNINSGNLKLLMNSGAKLKTGTDLTSDVFAKIHSKSRIDPRLIAVLINVGVPKKKRPGLVTAALKSRQSTSTIECILACVETHLWHRYPWWLELAVNKGSDFLLEMLLNGIGKVNQESLQALLSKVVKGKGYVDVKYYMVSILVKHGANPFPQKGRCVCHHENHVAGASGDETLSAFEWVIHNRTAYEICAVWKSTAPEMRPDPKTFFECIPRMAIDYERPLIKEWLEYLIKNDQGAKVEDTSEEV